MRNEKKGQSIRGMPNLLTKGYITYNMEVNTMKEEKIVAVKRRKIAGRDFFDPDNETARMLLSMNKSSKGPRVTFKPDDLAKLSSLGYEIKIKEPRIVYD